MIKGKFDFWVKWSCKVDFYKVWYEKLIFEHSEKGRFDFWRNWSCKVDSYKVWYEKSISERSEKVNLIFEENGVVRLVFIWFYIKIQFLKIVEV